MVVTPRKSASTDVDIAEYVSVQIVFGNGASSLCTVPHTECAHRALLFIRSDISQTITS